MSKIPGILLAVGMAASGAVADSFVCERDNSVLGLAAEALINHGARGSDRMAKDYEHQMIMDWDTAAITDWMTTNPLDAGDPYDYYKVELFVMPSGGWDAGAAVQIRTLNCGDDWAQGDGADWSDYNWTADTPASIYEYAQAYWTVVATTTVIDTGRSIPWKLENGTPVANLTALPYTCQNAEPFYATSAEHDTFVGVVLDDDDDPLNTNLIVDDLLNNPLNRGLRAWRTDVDMNPSAYLREQNGNPGPYASYLEVTIARYEPPVPTYTPGPAQRMYNCDRDAPMETEPTNSGNGGAQTFARAGKGGRIGGEQMLVEWNDKTIGTITTFIAGQLAANKLTQSEALSLGLLKVGYEFAGYSADIQKDVLVETVWCNYDWTEGNGTQIDDPFNWTTPTAVTWAMVQDAYVVTATGKERDPANALDWWDPSTGWPDQDYDNMSGTLNTAAFTGTLYQLDGRGLWNAVELDEAFWKDLFYNLQGEGTPFPTNYNCIGIRMHGLDWGDNLGVPDPGAYDNWRMWLKESGNAPRLVIWIGAATGDCVVDGEVNIIDLGILAANYKTGAGMTWWDGDFNGDGEVNIIDLGLLAANYRWQSSLVAGGGDAVPEPCSAILTLAGVGVLAGRRRRR